MRGKCTKQLILICRTSFFHLGTRKSFANWNKVLRISNGVFQGTVAAGDGVVFRMQRPPKEDVDGDVASFFTRKGYYVYGMQAFVDSSCRFLSISMKMCASTHDSTAYMVSDLSNAIREGRLASWAHIVVYHC
jgi:hypothetical protein